MESVLSFNVQKCVILVWDETSPCTLVQVVFWSTQMSTIILKTSIFTTANTFQLHSITGKFFRTRYILKHSWWTLWHYKYQIFLLLHFQRSNTAAAFIGVNDPHKTSVPLELCTNRWVKYFYSTEKLILHIWWGVALIFVNGLQRQYQVHFKK